MSSSNLPESLEGCQRETVIDKQSLKELFQKVEQGYEAQLKIMRVLLHSCGVFDEAKEDTNLGDEDWGVVKVGKTADSIIVGQVPDYAESESVDFFARKYTLPSVASSSNRQIPGRKVSDTSVNSALAPRPALTKQSAGAKSIPVSSDKSRIERQAKPFRGKNQKKFLGSMSFKHKVDYKNIRKHRPGLGSGSSHANAHIEVKKEHLERPGIRPKPKKNSNISSGRVFSRRDGEASSVSTSPKLIVNNLDLSERKECLYKINNVTHELSDDSDSEAMSRSSMKSPFIHKRLQNRDKTSLPSNSSTSLNPNNDYVVSSDKFQSDDLDTKSFKPIVSENV